MPALAVPVQNALFRRGPDLLAIQGESAVTIAGLGTAAGVPVISPPGSIPATQRGSAPGEYPDRATARDAKLFRKPCGRRKLLPAAFGLVEDGAGGLGQRAHPPNAH